MLAFILLISKRDKLKPKNIKLNQTNKSFKFDRQKMFAFLSLVLVCVVVDAVDSIEAGLIVYHSSFLCGGLCGLNNKNSMIKVYD